MFRMVNYKEIFFRGLPFSMYAILHVIWTPSPLFACNKQWKCIGDLTPPLGAYVLNGRPLMYNDH